MSGILIAGKIDAGSYTKGFDSAYTIEGAVGGKYTGPQLTAVVNQSFFTKYLVSKIQFGGPCQTRQVWVLPPILYCSKCMQSAACGYTRLFTAEIVWSHRFVALVFAFVIVSMYY